MTRGIIAIILASLFLSGCTQMSMLLNNGSGGKNISDEWEKPIILDTSGLQSFNKTAYVAEQPIPSSNVFLDRETSWQIRIIVKNLDMDGTSGIWLLGDSARSPGVFLGYKSGKWFLNYSVPSSQEEFRFRRSFYELGDPSQMFFISILSDRRTIIVKNDQDFVFQTTFTDPLFLEIESISLQEETCQYCTLEVSDLVIQQKKLDQNANNTETPEVFSLVDDLPAILPSMVGGRKPIVLSDYPSIPGSLSLDFRSNGEKMDLLYKRVPEELEKEIRLYNAEFARMGIDLNEIEFHASIVNEISWVLYPKNKITNAAYIVAINNQVRPCIDLNGYLDRDVNDDFFDLKVVPLSDPVVLSDASGWHIFAEIKGGNISRWYDALNDKVLNVDIHIINLVSRDDLPYYPKLSRITLKDLSSGRLSEIEKKWLEENPFSENIIPIEKISIRENKIKSYSVMPFQEIKPEDYTFEVDIKMIQILMGPNYCNGSNRPYKLVSYYVLWDEELFELLGISDDILENYIHGVKKESRYARLGIMSQAWFNPDGSTVILHTLVDLSNSSTWQSSDHLRYPSVEISNYKELDNFSPIEEIKVAMDIHSYYPELKPLEDAKKWVKTKIIPNQMENKLLGSSNWTYVCGD